MVGYVQLHLVVIVLSIIERERLCPTSQLLTLQLIPPAGASRHHVTISPQPWHINSNVQLVSLHCILDLHICETDHCRCDPTCEANQLFGKHDICIWVSFSLVQGRNRAGDSKWMIVNEHVKCFPSLQSIRPLLSENQRVKRKNMAPIHITACQRSETKM